MKSLFAELIHKIVSTNGEGHKRLEKHIESGEITIEEGELIKLRASAIILEKRLTELSASVESL